VASVQFHLETIVGDVADPAAVDQAVRGCEAVVHAGSVFSLDSRDARRVRQVNVCGTNLVLGAAHPSGGYQVVDVRDVAKVHAAVLEPAAGGPACPARRAGPHPGGV
jgi:nucleoside-diphosphate-sugar epimerase